MQICRQSTNDPAIGAEVLAADLESELVGFGGCHGDWEMIRESVLIDRLAHSAEWDRLRIDTRIDDGRAI